MTHSTNQIAALRAVCDALLPSLEGDEYDRRTASDLNVAERILELIGGLEATQQADFQQLMQLLTNPMLGLTWRGRLAAAQNLKPEELEKMLQSWSASSIEKLRIGFSTLKKLAAYCYFGDSKLGEINPNWAAIGYPGPLELPKNKPLFSFPETKKIPENGQIDCEILVIGSGAGGGVIADFLSQKGHDVVIVEKGTRPDFSTEKYREIESFRQFYDAQGLLATANGSVSILAGSVLGGGTTVNWSGAFRTPDYVLQEWAMEHGNPNLLTENFRNHFDFLENRMGVRPAERHNPQNQSLWDGAEKLGWAVKKVPVNQQKPTDENDITYWKSMGYSPLGDPTGIKQGTAATFLKDAVGRGARVFTDIFLEKILTEKGVAIGSTGITHLPNGATKKITIRAKKVIVSAGAIHSPALLLRSGLKHSEIGKNLFLHPTTAVSGIYDEISDPWHGHMMSAVCDEWTRISGNFGAKIETPPAHPGLLGSSMPWTNGADFKNEMKRVRFARLFIVLTRDKFGGSVRIGRDGQPIINYELSKFDRENFIRGQQETVRLQVAAGCSEATILHNQPLRFFPKTDNINTFLPKIAALSWKNCRFGLFSAHQMGTARMGGSNKLHPVLPTGETREIRNLFVADGSLFPTASGANPMLSIMALARFVGENV
jgi:choline dehydrogenase-like flavoprotein